MSTITAFNPFAAQGDVSCRQGLSSLVCQVLVDVTKASTTKVYQKCWGKWGGWWAQGGIPNNATSAPELADLLFRA